MPAVAPAEQHTPELHGSSNANRPARLRAPPQPAAARWSKPLGLPCRLLRGASRQACHAGGHAGRATQSQTVRESQRHPARKTARSTSTRRPQWSKPLGLPCRRSRRQSHTTPNGTGVPTPSGPHACALHLNPPPPVEQAARLAMPAVTPAEPHTPEWHGSPNACRPGRLRAPPQPAAPCGAGFLACGRLSSRPGPPLRTALCSTQCSVL